ncbi:gluconate kinase [Renibacterium salmoninarum ATCC 33209]|uniref:Gluconokinase n=1 Tax=Renibacterium salmoninarum (strain ATCC 33209 / DSM 20767 / JCM 11484 / NBRC 15589 / NCIMB 2235) TaxID=288705 RepID=A9WSG0_RENSM|nr:gluconokinase [Renibacterium salmoninarum]ABY23748.1 gluconate kinase [Renibacterium salmoninarum ATCC 33209]
MSAQPIVVVMGVSGSGKSTVAALLAGRLGWDYLEGDDLHPAENVAKMSAGIALQDEDRLPWLEKIALWIAEHEASGRPAVVTCSALKKSYRQRLISQSTKPSATIFVNLSGSREEISKRLSARHGHFMPTALLDSQFSALEIPSDDENSITVNISHSPADEAAEIVQRLRLKAD